MNLKNRIKKIISSEENPFRKKAIYDLNRLFTAEEAEYRIKAIEEVVDSIILSAVSNTLLILDRARLFDVLEYCVNNNLYTEEEGSDS